MEDPGELDKAMTAPLQPTVTMTTRGSNLCFRVERGMTREEAMRAQRSMGYDPAGYGFYGYKVVNGVTTWHCARSCD